MEYIKSMMVERDDLKYNGKMISGIVTTGIRILQYGNKLVYSENLEVKIGDEAYSGLSLAELKNLVSAYTTVDEFTVSLNTNIDLIARRNLDVDFLYVNANAGKFYVSCKGNVKSIVDRCLLDMVGFLANTNDGEFDDIISNKSDPTPVLVTNSVLSFEPTPSEIKRQDCNSLSLKWHGWIMAAIGIAGVILGALINHFLTN